METLAAVLGIASFPLSIVGLYLGFVSARPELHRQKSARRLSKLLARRSALEAMHRSRLAQLIYMSESLLIVVGIAAAGVMFTSLNFLPWAQPTFSIVQRWFFGGSIYLFTLYRLGKIREATTGYGKTMKELNDEISRIQAAEA